ncbi:hypothetical protein WI93_17560 [Burkholderia vietnamiensis]|nr:hypothetical protein WI93_17560 [Burkholderia vietnamiensis]
MLHATQDGIRNDKSQTTEIFGVVGKLEMKTAIQKANGGIIRNDRFKPGIVTKATMNARRSRAAEWCRVARTSST